MSRLLTATTRPTSTRESRGRVLGRLEYRGFAPSDELVHVTHPPDYRVAPASFPAPSSASNAEQWLTIEGPPGLCELVFHLDGTRRTATVTILPATP